MSRLKSIFQLLKASFTAWREDKAARLAAALAYYTIFSLAPLLVVTVAVAGLVFGDQAAQGQIVGEIEGTVGETAAAAIQEMIQNAGQHEASGIIATIVGLATLLLGASGVFNQLKDALNTIWDVQPDPNQGIWQTVKSRFLSFGMVLVVGFLLLVSLVISALLSAVGDFISSLLPSLPLLQALELLLSLAILTLLFALIFKVLPDVEVAWREVWVGALVTAVLFNTGKLFLSWYLANNSTASVYGAAGSVVLILLWVYYSAQILLFGAEFTQVYASRDRGQVSPPSPVTPSKASTESKASAPPVRQNYELSIPATMAAQAAVHTDKEFFIWPLGVSIGALRMKQNKRLGTRRLGKLAYWWLVIKQLFGYQPNAFTITIDGRQYKAAAAQVMLAHASADERPWQKDATTPPGNSHIDVCVNRSSTLLDYLKLFWSRLRRRPSPEPKVRRFQAQESIVINAERPLSVQGDGELIGQTPVAVSVVPVAMRVVQLQAA